VVDDPYLSFVAGLQASGRKAEGLGNALGGALGVAAEPYPHQVASVRRILSDTRVRHLISDEVGLGKTIQALMVVNALRYQNTGHRTVIVVPDRLVKQWYHECWTRAHVHPSVYGDEDDEAKQSAVRIVRPQSIEAGLFELDPAAYDLLIIDEPQLLSQRVIESIEVRARDFRQLLILSATPGLGDVRKRSQILSFLEPERAAIARSMDVDPCLLLEQQEAEVLEDPEKCAEWDNTALFNTFSSERRIIRATRRQWGRYLPERRYNRVEAEPLASERERLRLGMASLANPDASSPQTDRWLAAQALHRSHPSARDSSRGRSDPLLKQALEASASTPGDSKFDALTDLLLDIWSEHGREQVIIVAGDNPTIDFLERRLNLYFRPANDEFRISTLKRLRGSQDDEAADIRSIHEQLEDFSEGRSQVLLLGDWIQAGLNLHYFARNMIFYCSPWEVDAVDQLIGRLDRLRPNGLYRGDQGQHFGNIRVWTITMPGTADSRAVEGIGALGAYDRPLPPLDPEMESDIVEKLRELVLDGRAGNLVPLGEMAASWKSEGDRSFLSEMSPYSAEAAQRAHDVLQNSSLPFPVLKQSGASSYTARSEEAVSGWLDLISKGEFFAVAGRRDRQDESVKFNTIWYSDRDRQNPSIHLSDLGNRTWMAGHVPFLFKRKFLARPPHSTVNTDDGDAGGRPLHFLDHGGSLHDDLVSGLERHMLTICKPNSICRLVSFDPEHPIIHKYRAKTLFAVAAFFDSANLLNEPDLSVFQVLRDNAPTEAQKRAVKRDMMMVDDWWRSDQRWLREQIPASLLVTVFLLDGTKWVALDELDVRDVLDPWMSKKDVSLTRTRSRTTPMRPDQETAAWVKAKSGLSKQLKQILEQAEPKFPRNIKRRIQQINQEVQWLVDARNAAHLRLRNSIAPEGDPQFAGRVASAERALERSIIAGELRLSWLQTLAVEYSKMSIQLLGSLFFKPAPREDV
jgi:ATP-dependent helicase HepA